MIDIIGMRSYGPEDAVVGHYAVRGEPEGHDRHSLGNISHYATEPPAMKLEKPHPELAARLWRAQAMRIVDAGKSKYYEAAAANLEWARRCYVRAGLVAEWEDAVRQIRADHYRKTTFMAAFESVAAGAGHQAPPSFLERAKDRWGVGSGGGRK